MIEKRCYKCKNFKNLTEFNNDKSRTDGKSYICKICENKRNIRYIKENKEKISIYQVKYYKEHKKERCEYDSKYYQEHRDKVIKHKSKYQKDHPEVYLKSSKKYLTELGKLFNKNSIEYKYSLINWSKTIKNRDNNECQICGSKEDLNVHHILHKAKYPELSLNINNGITLCQQPCHYEVHGKQLTLKVTKETYLYD